MPNERPVSKAPKKRPERRVDVVIAAPFLHSEHFACWFTQQQAPALGPDALAEEQRSSQNETSPGGLIPKKKPPPINTAAHSTNKPSVSYHMCAFDELKGDISGSQSETNKGRT